MATRQRASARRSVASLGDTSDHAGAAEGVQVAQAPVGHGALPSFTGPVYGSAWREDGIGTRSGRLPAGGAPDRKDIRVPTYEYRCDNCATNFDVVQSFHDDPLTECPTCGSPVRKVFGSVGIVFKGSGFYKTDSRSGSRAVEANRLEPPPASGSTTSAPTADGTGLVVRKGSAPRPDKKRRPRPTSGRNRRPARQVAGFGGDRRVPRRPPPERPTESSGATGRVGSGPADVTGATTTLRSPRPVQSGPVEWRTWTVADLDRLLIISGSSTAPTSTSRRGPPPGADRRRPADPRPTSPRSPPRRPRQIAEAMMTESVLETFRKHHEADFAYSIPGTGRFRVNAYYQRSSAALAIRRVRATRRPPRSSDCPRWSPSWPRRSAGLVLVTGPTGSGKTTTLAAMVDHINHPGRATSSPSRTRSSSSTRTTWPPSTSARSASTPIRSPRPCGSSSARTPTSSWSARCATRRPWPPPSRAAETGHLVFSTLHTINATETINRIVDFFPPTSSPRSGLSLAGSLQGSFASG